MSKFKVEFEKKLRYIIEKEAETEQQAIDDAILEHEEGEWTENIIDPANVSCHRL